MDKQQAYKILGVTSKDTVEQITKQYRKKCLKYHPDKNSSLAAIPKFHKIKQAYELLLVETSTCPFEQDEPNQTFRVFVSATVRDIYLKIPVTVHYTPDKTVTYVPDPKDRVVVLESGDDKIVASLLIVENTEFYFENGMLVKKVVVPLPLALSGQEFNIQHITGSYFKYKPEPGTYPCPMVLVSVPHQNLALEFSYSFDSDSIPAEVQDAVKSFWR